MQNMSNSKPLIYFFLVFISFYGTIAVFFDNTIFKISKDIILIFIVLSFLFSFFTRKGFEKQTFSIISMLVIFSCISAIGLFGNSSGYSSTDFVYGVKTTIFPMLGLLIGISLREAKVNIVKPLYIVFFLIIIVWFLQRMLGVESLMSMGFEYGVNVKTFNGNLRLPSLVGTPDGYAFLLSLIGILIDWDLTKRGKKKLAILFKVLTLVFLLLATIRSAIIFWLIYQLITTLRSFAKLPRSYGYTVLGLLMFLIIPVVLGGTYIFTNTTLGSVSSTQDRLSHWGDNLSPLFSHQGLYGEGIGSVGAASVSTAALNTMEKSYAVDNQFFAIYEQMGISGVILLFLLFLTLMIGCLNANRTGLENNANALIIALGISSMFTNCLEMYPFNIILWIQIGMAYRNSYSINYELGVTNKEKKPRIKFCLFETPEQKVQKQLKF
ncbi:hypothetical protein [Priestia megaterium]|uniref:hypothetical protein n=1 Tax=Priestia megaterium TaxID=1404 RepID=UPI000EF993C6|nr:hypothetical protein [Priestia megaterium]RMA94460.1 hypothetical protein DEU44_0599 [Priestia megaterium]